MKKELFSFGGRDLRPLNNLLKRAKPYIILFLIGFVYYIVFTLTSFRIPCMFRRVSSLFIEDGLLCPGCGITRMIAAELKLDFKTAFMENQMVFILQPLIYYEILKLIICDVIEVKPKYSLWERILLVIVIVTLLGFGVGRNIYRIHQLIG